MSIWDLDETRSFTAEELRRLWLDLYRDEVTRLAQLVRTLDAGDHHARASAHADRHINHFADRPQAHAAEMERVSVESLTRGQAAESAASVGSHGRLCQPVSFTMPGSTGAVGRCSSVGAFVVSAFISACPSAP